MSAAECGSCQHRNRPGRGYCAACGAGLQPVCRGCRFINDDGDHFCGGCGSPLVLAAATGTGTVVSGTVPAKERTSLDELSGLFAPAPAVRPSAALPAVGVTQADLDRLFGGTS